MKTHPSFLPNPNIIRSSVKFLVFAFLSTYLLCATHGQETSTAIQETLPEESAAPALTPAPTEPGPSTPVVIPGETPSSETSDSSDLSSEPAPYPTEKIIPKERKSKTPRVIPQSYGDRSGEVFIAHRSVIDRYAGWGWMREEKETWRKGRWVMLEEKPGLIKAPGRFLAHPDHDDGTQYKFYGQWAPYKGYEPNFDVMVDVFQIKGFELIGPGQDLPKMSPPRSNRGRSNRESTYQRGAGVAR
jgi:hypothetical protein